MGVVYEATQDQPQRAVALKVIRPDLASSGQEHRFQREAEVLGQLQHPAIACIHDAGIADIHTPGGDVVRKPFFAMELIHGVDICALLCDLLDIPTPSQCVGVSPM